MRLIYAVLFACAGVAFIFSARYVGSARAFIHPASGDDSPDTLRLRDAVERRTAIESRAYRISYGTIGGAVLIAIATLTWLTPIPIPTAYALFMLTLALVVALSQLLHVGRPTRRAATLTPRARQVPQPWAMIFPAIGAAASLSFIDVSPLGAWLVTAAAGIMTLTAYAIARDDAMVTAEDPIADRYVDERLRSSRYLTVVSLANTPAFIFGLTEQLNIAHTASHAVLHIVACEVDTLTFVVVQAILGVTMSRQSARDKTGSWLKNASVGAQASR